MKIKNSSLIVALAVGGLLAGLTVASAQDTNTPAKPPPPRGQGPNLDRQLERMTTELTLTDAQKPKVKAVLEENMKKRQELRDTPVDQRREKMKEMQEETSKQMKAILDAQQFEKWQKMAADMRQRRPGGPGGPGGPGAGGPPPEKKDPAKTGE